MMKKIKNTLLIWLAAWPTITIILTLLPQALFDLPLVLRTLIITGLMVPTMTMVAIPLLHQLINKLFPESNHH